MVLAIWSMTFNVIGHLGHEIFPTGWAKMNITNTVTHHHMHHQTFNHNYGLYFPWWDRMMGTEHPLYVEVFDHIVDPKRDGIKNISAIARELKAKDQTKTQSPGREVKQINIVG